MTSVTSGELQKNFGAYRTIAMKEPVTVTNHGRDDLVILSFDEYRRLQMLESRAFHASEMTAEELSGLNDSAIPAAAAQFDAEIG